MLNPNLSPRCQLRADLYEDRVPNKIVIIGDRPGPGTPLTQKRVPFCCDKHSSGWLNKQLTIPEEDLRWLNAADENGVETENDKSGDPSPFTELRDKDDHEGNRS